MDEHEIQEAKLMAMLEVATAPTAADDDGYLTEEAQKALQTIADTPVKEQGRQATQSVKMALGAIQVPRMAYGSEAPGPGWRSTGVMEWSDLGSGGSPRVAIVGGGPAGLFTAYILSQHLPEAGLTVFEASGRLGGKIDTAHFSDGTPFEAGVAQLYSYDKADPLRQLIEEDLGLATMNLSGGGIVLRDSVLRDRADLEDHFGEGVRKQVEAFCRKVAKNKERSLRACIEEVKNEDTRRYLETALAADLACESCCGDGFHGIQNVLPDEHEHLQLYHVQGGLSRIVPALCAKVRAEFRADARVLALYRADADRYRLKFQEYGHDRYEEFDYVVLAMPPPWLVQIYTEEPLRQRMKEFLGHFKTPIHSFRVSLLFSEAWWRRFDFPGHFWMMDLFGGCCVYDESARWQRTGAHSHCLSFLLWGQDALLMCAANQTTEAIACCLVDRLPADWRPEARVMLLEARVDRFAGAGSVSPSDWSAKERKSWHQPEPKKCPGVLLASDAFFGSTLNAALQSANVAVELLLADQKVDGLKASKAVEALTKRGV